MSTEPAPHLHVVADEDRRVAFDSSTGEICPNCELMRQDREGLELDLRRLRRQIADLRRDVEAEAMNNELFPIAKRAFEHWRIVCDHRRSPFTVARFWEVEPYLRNKKYGEEVVMRAIDGAAYQSWVSERSNGSLKVSNAWASIFSDADTFEERANRAPRGWTPRWSTEMENWPTTKPTAAHVKGWFGVRPPAGWAPPTQADVNGQTSLMGNPSEEQR